MPIAVEDTSVQDVMDRWPKTLAVFIRYRMHCIGCAVAPYHTVAEACAEHGLDRAPVCAALSRAIAASGFGATQ